MRLSANRNRGGLTPARDGVARFRTPTRISNIRGCPPGSAPVDLTTFVTIYRRTP